MTTVDGPMVEAVAVTVAALDPPEQDAALVALAEYLADVLDSLRGDLKDAMAGQTAPQLLKTLEALEQRAVRRRGKAPQGAARASKVAQLRAVHQSGQRKRAG